MGAAHRRRIRNLLKQGTLTGFEVAKIVMSQIYHLEKIAEPELYDLKDRDTREHCKEAWDLTTEEINALKKRNLKGRNDKIEEYNNWLGAISSFRSLVYCAHVHYLQIQNLLSFPMVLLERYLTEVIIKFGMMQVPDIVTEKQYQDLKSAQRRDMLKEEHELGWVLYWRAETIAEKDFGDGCMEILLERCPGRAIDAYHQACSDIRSLLKKGKLSLPCQENIIALLEDMSNTKSDKEILALIDSTLSREAKIQQEKPEPPLRNEVKVKDLSKSGLPEWIKHVDEYKHNYGKCAPYDVAIIQNPSPDMIDEKGYYKKRNSFGDHPYLAPPDASFWERSKQTSSTFFTGQLLKTKYYISLFLFRKSLLKSVSEVTGINFSEQVDKWYDAIKRSLKVYKETLNRALTVSDRARKSLSGTLHTINLEELQISPMLEEKFRERLSKPLEIDKWVLDCGMYFIEEMKEKAKDGVFEHKDDSIHR
jgi:hypothetical protein